MAGDAVHDQSGHAALHVAAVKGHSHLVRLLCKVGVDASSTQHGHSDGATPLHLAAKYNKQQVAETLLSPICGAHESLSKKWRDTSGKIGTPLAHANTKEIVALLAREAKAHRERQEL